VANLQATDISDLITSTINELGRMKFTDITTDVQRHIALPKLLKKNRQSYDSGPQVQFNLMVDHNHSARAVGLGARDANWAVVRQVIAMNRSPGKIVDYVKTQRLGCLISLAEYFEDRLWKVPASTDTLNPYGIPYWIVKNNTEGFNGGAPSGYTTVGNINPTTYTRWRNWTAQYTAVTKDDLVAKWWKAAYYTDWKPAVDGMPTFNTGDDYGFYTNYAVCATLKQILEDQNENLGYDLDSVGGRVSFQRSPVTPVIKLDADTTNPVYGINWGEFKQIVLSGEWMNETQIANQPGQHTVSATHVDCTLNWVTRNRRRHFVLATNTGLPA
jgi:hypothetical protein